MSNIHPTFHDRNVHDNPMSIARAALAISLLAAVSYWAPAFAVPQDTPTTIDGVKAVCTGVGESKNDPRWRAYPLKLVFANTKGDRDAFRPQRETACKRGFHRPECGSAKNGDIGLSRGPNGLEALLVEIFTA
jgi:hypothetical protein